MDSLIALTGLDWSDTMDEFITELTKTERWPDTEISPKLAHMARYGEAK